MKGRPKGSKKENSLLLDYRDWVIETDKGFASTNFIVRRKGDSHHAYCGCLEQALKMVHDALLLENVDKKYDYKGTIGDLRNIIIETKNEFALLLDACNLIKNSYKIVEKQTPSGEGDSSC